MRTLNCLLLCVAFRGIVCVYIENNAYRDIGVVVSDNVQINKSQLSKLKETLTLASGVLYTATKKRVYFGEFVVSLPPSADFSDVCTSVSKPSEEVDVLLRKDVAGIRALHSRGCGEKGELVLMSVDWLSGNADEIARQFVKEWSTYRYGVFDESAAGIPCQRTLLNKIYTWVPGGCYNLKLARKPEYEEGGIPECPVSSEFLNHQNLTSSLMAHDETSQISHFCDGSPSFPHNPAFPTLHNNLCDGSNVWSIIESSSDFQYNRNKPLEEDIPPSKPTFNCYQNVPAQLTIAVQTEGVKPLVQDRVDLVMELQYNLYHFLANIPSKDTKVNLVTFSDEKNSDPTFYLDLSNKDDLKKTLKEAIAQDESVKKLCLVCGLEKALNASKANFHPQPVVVLVAFESAIAFEDKDQLVEMIKSYNRTQLHLILIRNTTEDLVRPVLIAAIRSTGGFLYLIPVDPSSILNKLNSVLAGIVNWKTPLERQTFVIHENSFNVTSAQEIEDSFIVPKGVRGTLMYQMHCFPKKGTPSNSECDLWDTESPIMKCGTVKEWTGGSADSFSYKFSFSKGFYKPLCSSLALLAVDLKSDTPFTFRGWLSDHLIAQGRNDLIIYAEVVGSANVDLRVEAVITGIGFETPFQLELRDNGNGDPDTQRGDGIYSRYFTSYVKKGTYQVHLSVRQAEDLKFNPRSPTSFMQHRVSIGTFSVVEDPPTYDILPPNRIGDLKLLGVDRDNFTVQLQWTAPGDNYDWGTAFSYEVKSATSHGNLREKYFDSEENDVMVPKLPLSPQKGGSEETAEFYLPGYPEDSTVYVSIRALDSRLNRGKASNIVTVYLSIAIEPSTTSDTSLQPNTNDTGSSSPDTTNANDTASTTQPTTDVITSENDTDTSWRDRLSSFFDEKTTIVLSSAGGFLLVIVIINIIVCCCCFKKRGKSEIGSRETSLRPPLRGYNMKVSYQRDSHTSNMTESDLGLSLTNLAESNNYSDQNASTGKRYYYTNRSLQNRRKKHADSESELGFDLVQTVPAYATSSLSKLARKLNNKNFDEEERPSVAQPQRPAISENSITYVLSEER